MNHGCRTEFLTCEKRCGAPELIIREIWARLRVVQTALAVGEHMMELASSSHHECLATVRCTEALCCVHDLAPGFWTRAAFSMEISPRRTIGHFGIIEEGGNFAARRVERTCI